MFGEAHDLLHEFPEHKERIHHLKMENNHFARFFNEYHELDHQLHRIQQDIETPSDEVVEELKKKRLQLKDDLLAMITAE
ncbi:MAG: GTP-binding protein [uncultured Thiotrichaceae bacterium]|uniref:GTP-binding protein n=1 Tax=uncultured Thiotrichaceae bacterium TaxID=298394 RepID=A0A6S6SXY5_9GAMM|nr:MAG: GTP-binding protein [uncultured Thiotrichaceae bacterium]